MKKYDPELLRQSVKELNDKVNAMRDEMCQTEEGRIAYEQALENVLINIKNSIQLLQSGKSKK